MTRAADVEGTIIPQGAKAVLFLGFANRDPRRWLDPEIFDVGRAASGREGFEFAMHQYLGYKLARKETELLLTVLVRRVEGLRLIGEPVRRLHNPLHGLASMPVESVPA